jgi:hypothetical protein
MSLNHQLRLKAERNKFGNFLATPLQHLGVLREGGVLMNQADPAFPRREVISSNPFKDTLTISEVRAHPGAVSFSHAYGGLR